MRPDGAPARGRPIGYARLVRTADQVSRWLAAAAGDGAEDPGRELLAVGPEDVEALDPLCRALADERFSHRWLAARTLGQMRAAASVPALLGCMDAEDEALRRHSAVALGRIGTSSRDVVERLTRALEDGDLLVRAAAAGALLGVGEVSPEARDVLARALRSEQLAVSYWAAEGLVEALAVVPALLPDVLAMLDHGNDAIVEGASRAIAGRPPDEVIPPLLRALVAGSAEMKRGALHALGDVGAAARGATDAIAAAMLDAQVLAASDERVRVWAARLVELVPVDHPGVKDATLRLLGDGGPWVRERAAYAILALRSATEQDRELARSVLDEP